MAVPSGATRADYNFSVFTSGGDPIYAPITFPMSLEDLSGAGLTTLEERNNLIQIGMDAIRAELISKYPNATVNASRTYVVPPVTGDPWPTP